jgi:uncharacterized small protein (DUF1192 family)
MEADEPRPKPTATIGQDLRTLSVADLEAYIAALRAEIARVEAEIARKRDVRGAAEALFKSRAPERGGEGG